MSFKDDVNFYLSKGKNFYGVNLYEDDDEEDEFDTDKEEDTKKKKSKSKKAEAEEDSDENEEEDTKAAVRDEPTDDLIKRVIKIKAKARGDKMPEDFGSTPEEAGMYFNAVAKDEQRKRIKKEAEARGDKKPKDFGKLKTEKELLKQATKSSISTKTVADDGDDSYHPKPATMKEEILGYLH